MLKDKTKYSTQLQVLQRFGLYKDDTGEFFLNTFRNIDTREIQNEFKTLFESPSNKAFYKDKGVKVSKVSDPDKLIIEYNDPNTNAQIDKLVIDLKLLETGQYSDLKKVLDDYTDFFKRNKIGKESKEALGTQTDKDIYISLAGNYKFSMYNQTMADLFKGANST